MQNSESGLHSGQTVGTSCTRPEFQFQKRGKNMIFIIFSRTAYHIGYNYYIIGYIHNS